MAKNKKIVVAILCLFATLLIAVLCVVPSHISNDSFRQDLVSLYSKYDADSSNSKFTLKRLMIFDFDGNTYNAVDYAVDKKHDFAVLQFDTIGDAEKAYNNAVSDNHIVDVDSVSTLNTYEKGEMYPLGSNTVGATQFINNYQMGYDDVLVAVIDTGVMFDHDDLKGRFYNYGYDYSTDGCDNAQYDKNLQSNAFHATFISGIIANNTPDNVKIVPYKVVPFGSNVEYISGAISAIFHATDLGVDVINISFSSGAGDEAYKKAIKYATDRGVCVCVSAGNTGEEITQSYPAMTENAITVSALNSTCQRIATYSSYGDCIDFCAPGSKIYSSVPLANGRSGYESYSGTSFSTPYITALCANIKSMNNKLSYSDTYKILCDFSVDFGEYGFDDYYGNGVPNFSNIVYSNENYRLNLPQGRLAILNSTDYSRGGTGWSLFADKIVNVSFENSVNSVGSYELYGLSKANFEFNEPLISVGDYAFYGCENLNEITFDIDVKSIGKNAFNGVSNDFVINGYSNTPAEQYANLNNIKFNSYGCRHSFSMDIVEPIEGKEGYTIYTCTACGYSYIGEYVEPTVILDGYCGSDVYFELFNTGRLSLSGYGNMYSYINEKAPWADYASAIKTVSICDEVRSVSAFAFYGCNNIFEFNSSSPYFSIVDSSLYSANGKRLVMALPNKPYSMPNDVTDFSSDAFLNYNGKIEFNSKFRVEDSIVYDQNDNVIMALSSYDEECLVISSECDIKSYAFILTDYPLTVRASTVSNKIGDYAIGYSFDGIMVKDKTAFAGYSDTSIFDYCVNNGFDITALNEGVCGDNINWRFDAKSNELSLTGYGDMYSFKKLNFIPWYDYMPLIKSIVIDDKITSISNYSFGGASAVNSIVMPLSLNLSSTSSTWMGCSNVQQIRLTQGTGIMPNYTSSSVSYTPWYKSRNNLKSLIISPDVEYIGSYAFKNISVIKTLQLNNCIGVGSNAFNGCSNLKLFVNYSKQTEFGVSCFPKADIAFYAFDDSSTRDYCLSNSFDYISLGCDHSRAINAQSELPYCCYDTMVTYICADCENVLYTEYAVADKKGHYAKATVTNANNKPIENAEVYVNGRLSAKTNEYGRFVIGGLLCNNRYNIEVKKHGVTLSSTNVVPDKTNNQGNAIINYGDFVNDGVINAKDYAFGIQNGFDDLDLLNINTSNGYNMDMSVKYNIQDYPYAVSIYNEQNELVDYRRDFYAEINFGVDYKIIDYGFLYGKNMTPDFMVLSNVGSYNDEGYELKKAVLYGQSDINMITYGSSSKTGRVGARIYIVYSNGVDSFTYYSDVSSYSYD